MTIRLAVLALSICTLMCVAAAQSVYRYQDDDGRWHYADRPPADGRKADVNVIENINLEPKVIVTREKTGDGTTIYVENEFHGAVEFEIRLLETRNVGGVDTEPQKTILPPAKKIPVLQVMAKRPGNPVSFRYKYKYMLGEPEAEHDNEYLYRVPFAVTQRFPVSQAFPMSATHNAPGSRYAIDFAMPEETAIHAARGGTVVEIAFRSYSGGTTAADAPKANLVRIVHDDGTMAVYAHLALDSVRVRPGDRVQRGEFIASSGNTGFSSGPHLHFGVERNVGFSLESVPVKFVGAGGVPAQAKTGKYLQAY